MRKFFAVCLLLSLWISLSQTLIGQTRPRRVEEPVTAQDPDDDQRPVPSRRPVLTGNIGTGNQDAKTQPQRQSDGPVEIGEGDTVRVETTLVTIPVSVTDREGRFIPNLIQEDFRIFENGVEHKVAYFAPVEKPFTVALVIDTSNSTRFRLEEIQDAAIAFVNQLRSDDRVMVVAFAENVKVLCEPTNDRNVLRNAIKRVNNGGGTSLYDAVDYVINRRMNHITGRKAIVLFTDGVDTTSRIATYEGNLHDVEEVDALIYPVQYNTFAEMNAGQSQRNSSDSGLGILIDILSGGRVSSRNQGGGRGASRADYERADRYLGDLAERTGARRYRAENTQNLERSFALVAEELRRQYGIGYYPQTVAQTGERRQVKVRVNRPNMIVRARESYIAGEPGVNPGRQGP
jgi:VWFA-related protein